MQAVGFSKFSNKRNTEEVFTGEETMTMIKIMTKIITFLGYDQTDQHWVLSVLALACHRLHCSQILPETLEKKVYHLDFE